MLLSLVVRKIHLWGVIVILLNIPAGTLMEHIMASMSLVFLLFLVVPAPAMAVSAMSAAAASGGVLLRPTMPVRGTGPCSVASGMCTAIITVRDMGSVSNVCGMLINLVI